MPEILASTGSIDNRNKKGNNYLHFNHNSCPWSDGIPEREVYVSGLVEMGYPLQVAKKAWQYVEKSKSLGVSYASH